MDEHEIVIKDQILRANPLVQFLEQRGIKVRGGGDQRSATRCAALQHKFDHWCVSVNAKTGVWFCQDCKIGGSVFDWMMREENKSFRDVFAELKSKHGFPQVATRTETRKPPEKMVATYDYTDERGKLIYQAVRFEPKGFRQRQPAPNNGWNWNMEGVTRILYRLPEVLKARTVLIAEGEKDCDALAGLGWAATCNVGGAGKWLHAYSDTLRGKDVIVIPDNDPPGEKHGKEILASLTDKAASVKVAGMPPPHKDASDYIATFPDAVSATKALKDLFERTPHAVKPLPVMTMAELEDVYRKSLEQAEEKSFDLGKFSITLGMSVRKLVPGELALIIATTGTGKTALLSALARAAYPLPTLLFELELPGALLFERFVQMDIGCSSHEVEDEYRGNMLPLWKGYQKLSHIMVCAESGVSTEQIESYIYRSELKFGHRPVLVLVDYVGLVKATGRSRYEQVSYVAEQMKVIAKRTETIIIMASQISRAAKDKKESEAVGLYDAKDSGSLECSAGLVIGAWRPDLDHINLKILKNTKGRFGKVIGFDFDGARMQIKETPIVEK